MEGPTELDTFVAEALVDLDVIQDDLDGFVEYLYETYPERLWKRSDIPEIQEIWDSYYDEVDAEDANDDWEAYKSNLIAKFSEEIPADYMDRTVAEYMRLYPNIHHPG